jgi:hypothetical protein
MIGAVASLKDKELVEIYKKYTSIYQRKKKFVRARAARIQFQPEELDGVPITDGF